MQETERKEKDTRLWCCLPTFWYRWVCLYYLSSTSIHVFSIHCVYISWMHPRPIWLSLCLCVSTYLYVYLREINLTCTSLSPQGKHTYKMGTSVKGCDESHRTLDYCCIYIFVNTYLCTPLHCILSIHLFIVHHSSVICRKEGHGCKLGVIIFPFLSHIQLI